MPQHPSTFATPATDKRETFGDVTCDLGIGIKTLIFHLDKAFDAGFELELEMGRDVMDSIIAAQWVAQRLSKDIHAVGSDFEGTRSE
ncbi:hypothetical protein [Nitrobacter sp.]|uniref:hypothetical protein n=1 Tax=Nitrobacter sp. TaxID=29420 RepID=UPI001D1A9BAE|nr:hypothetical protein [Nitrobacter sp.]MCB1394154.1 hypothetical protein [Nitrobacter sp.]MCV0387337.1 hypothetical protein [Nitrobacter sp.]